MTSRSLGVVRIERDAHSRAALDELEAGRHRI